MLAERIQDQQAQHDDQRDKQVPVVDDEFEAHVQFRARKPREGTRIGYTDASLSADRYRLKQKANRMDSIRRSMRSSLIR